MSWRSMLSRPRQTTIRRSRTGYRPTLEMLEDRTTPTAVSFMNDNWVLVTDNGAAGLSQGDVIDNRLDVGAPSVTATYGVDGFGIVTQNTAGTPLGVTSLAAFDQIGDAIANTDLGGTANVLQGSYNEAVVLNRSIALLGAQASANAVTRTGVPESLLTSSSATATIDVTASNAIVAGFTLQNNALGAGVRTGATVSGFAIRNNIIQNNLQGIALASNGVSISIVEQNLIQNNNQGPAPTGGFGLLANAVLSNTVVRLNKFSGNNTDGALFLGTAGLPISNVTIQANQFANNDRLEVAHFDNGAISGNTFTAGVAGGGAAAALHVGGGSDNLQINLNTFTDLRTFPIAVDSALTGTTNTNVSLVGNIIRQDVALLPAVPTINLIDVTAATGVNLLSENVIFLRGTIPGGVTAVNGIRLGSASIGTVNITGNVVLADGIGGAGSANLQLDATLSPSAVIVVTSNTFSGGAFGINIGQGAGGLPSIQIHLNNFLKHTTAGLNFNGAGAVNATLNFWNSFNGPTNALNPGGTGDALTISGGGTVTFSPFQTAVQLPFGDDFTGTNGSALSNAWLQVLGTFTIQGNAAVPGVAPLNLAALGTQATDVALQADVTLAAGDSHADLFARYSGAGDQNMYMATLSKVGGSTFAQIYVNVNGTWTLLDSEIVAVSGTATLRFEVFGNSLRLFVNGTLAAQAFDSTIAGPGLMGIRSSTGVTFDHFLSTFIASVDASLPFSDGFILPNNSILGSPWNAVTGSFTIQNQTAVGVQTLNQATIGNDTTDVSIQATVNLAGNNSYGGLVARHSGPGDTNMYFATLVNFNGTFFAQIYRNVGGTWVLLASTTVASGNAVLRFDVIGDSLKLFVNGALAVSATDSMLATGKAGIRGAAGVSFDNFSITQQLKLVAPIPFNDTFTGVNGADLSGFWQTQVGTFNLSAGAAISNAALSLATLVQAGLGDASVTTTVTLAAGDLSYAGIAARYNGTDDTNMYYGVLVRSGGTTTAQIYVNVDGVWTLLGSANVSVGATVTLRFDVVGSSLKLFVNGTLAVYAFDSTFTTGTFGIRGSTNVTFDNFSIDVRTPTTPALPFNESFTATADRQLSTNWREVVGNYDLQTSAAVGVAGVNQALVNGIDLTNVSVRADVTLTASNNTFAGLIARYSGPDEANMYFATLLQLDGVVYAQIYRNLNGTWTSLSSTVVSVSGSTTLRFDVIGNSLRLYVDGVLATFAFDSALSAGGVGIRSSQNTVIDEFHVEAV